TPATPAATCGRPAGTSAVISGEATSGTRAGTCATCGMTVGTYGTIAATCAATSGAGGSDDRHGARHRSGRPLPTRLFVAPPPVGGASVPKPETCLLSGRKERGQKRLVVLERLELRAALQGGVELLLESRVHRLRLPELLQGDVLVPVDVLEEAQEGVAVGVVRRVPRGAARGVERLGVLALLQEAVRGLLIEVGKVEVEQTPQLGQRLGVVVDVDVDVAVVVDVAAALLAHHEHRRRLVAARVAPRLERRVELLRQLARRALERLPHRFRHLRPDEDVPLRRPGLPLAVAR